MADKLVLADAVQGMRHVGQTLTWPGGLDLTGAVLSAVKRTRDGVTITAVDGELAAEEGTDGVFTWTYGAGDVGAAGMFFVQFTATFDEGDATIESVWRVHPLLEAVAVAAEAVVGVTLSEGTFLTALLAAAAAATDGQVATADGAGGVGFQNAAAVVSAFVGLSDTPGSITADQALFGNAAGDGLEFKTASQVRSLIGALAVAGGTMTGPLTLPDGVAGTPALRFTTGSDDGLFQSGDSSVSIAISGDEKFRFTQTGGDGYLYLKGESRIHWSQGANLTTTRTILQGLAAGGLDTYHFLATTNAVVDLLKMRHQSTGTPAAGFGTGVLLQGKSSTTQDQNMARVSTAWNVATHASRVADVVVQAAYSGGWSEILRGRAGASPLLGFLGAAPVARQAHIADASGDDAATVNAILDVLEAFGLVATS